MTGAKKRSRGERKARILLRRIGIWLDSWCLRGYTPDTSDWQSKLESLRNIRKSPHHPR